MTKFNELPVGTLFHYPPLDALLFKDWPHGAVLVCSFEDCPYEVGTGFDAVELAEPVALEITDAQRREAVKELQDAADGMSEEVVRLRDLAAQIKGGQKETK